MRSSWIIFFRSFVLGSKGSGVRSREFEVQGVKFDVGGPLCGASKAPHLFQVASGDIFTSYVGNAAAVFRGYSFLINLFIEQVL